MELPVPEPGLVISYAYLGHHEHSSGQEEGRKDLPCVILLAVTREGDHAPTVIVLPVTHQAPVEKESAVEIPLRVKRYLHLDDEPSWILVSEGNEFVWPGHDLRRRPDADRCDYGFLPPKLFKQVRDAFVAWHRSGRLRRSPR
jgi:hypothetical protein